MATTTQNLALIKPAGTDKIRIAQINANMDTLDTKIGPVGNTSLQAQINAINTKNTSQDTEIGKANTMPVLASFATVAELNSALDTAVSDMPEGGILRFRVNATATVGVFAQNAVYFGVLYKSALNQYCHVMLYPNFILAPVSGVRLQDTWSYTRLLTAPTTTTLTATLRDGGASGTALTTGTATIKRNEGFIDFTLSITDCNSVAITNFASITFSSSLPSQIPAYFPIMIRRGGQAYFIVTAQNNAGASLTIRGGDIGSQGNPSWTFDSANTAIYAHEFVAI